ncbi:hypothetical protein ICN84_05065 [Akkermansia glycaniphila]|uniref:hypothetical protein n=1 Tax=Akkermansia glycaniphila TaxID=1679444 RepID=UPI001C024A8F|nr:hypothetical protein [Akkermansia glycaniphila]MBT9449444.1 hypothetical protein [Akkermansia glycaniphila]
MEMKKYSQLALWSIFSVLMIQSLSAKEVLSADFKPTTVLLESDEIVIQKNLARGEKLDKTNDDIYSIVKDGSDYKTMHPKLKEWIDKNKDNFKQISPEHFVLYRDDDVGAELNVNFNPTTKKRSIYFNRVYFKNPEDSAWQYTQTPAINPKTKKPWFPFEKSDVQRIEKVTKQKFSKEDASYLIDLLSILNENFHFYYGEEFVSLKGKIKDKSTLMGKYHPLKVLAYGAFDEFLPPESEQKRELSTKLGRAVYPFYKMIDNSKMFRGTANCGEKGTVTVHLKDGQTAVLRYWNQINPKDIHIGASEWSTQIGNAKYNLEQLSKRLMDLVQEKGVDVLDEKANKTPLTLALYQINLKVQNDLEAVITNEYLVSGGPNTDFGQNKNLADVIKLPTNLKPIKSLKTNLIKTEQTSVTNMCYPPRTR